MDFTTNIKQIMTTRIVTVELDDKLSMVSDIFKSSNFHHLLAVEDRELIGIVSDGDLFKAISPNIGSAVENYKDTATLNKRVHQIMSRHPVVLTDEATFGDAIDLFNAKNVSCIPIVNAANCPVGIVSWRDILKHLR